MLCSLLVKNVVNMFGILFLGFFLIGVVYGVFC